MQFFDTLFYKLLIARTCLVVDPRYCNITWSKTVWICHIWKTLGTILCVLRHGEMAWPCFLNCMWSEKNVTNPSLKTFMFCFTPGRSSQHGRVSCGIQVWTGPLDGHKYPVTSVMGFHWELVQEDTSLLIPHRGEAHSYCMLKSKIWHEKH